MAIDYSINKINFAAVFKEHRLRLSDGFIESMFIDHGDPRLRYGYPTRADRLIHRPPIVNLSISVGASGVIVEKYDPFETMGIGCKIIDDCTNDELLYVLQYRLGLTKNGIMSV